MRKLETAAILLTLLITACQANSQGVEQTLSDIRNQYNLVGMAAGVHCEGTPVLMHYGGTRNLFNNAPVNAQTHFRIASISKAYTAAGLMRLYEMDAFALDDDISAALGYTLRHPAFPNVPITYRMLLSHTASLQDGGAYSDFLNATTTTDDPPSIAEVLQEDGDFYAANMWRLAMPGTEFAYSNIAYGLIGTLIEALSAERFDIFMKNEVLGPLGISGSFNINHLDNLSDLAVLYRNSVAQADNFQGLPPFPFNNDEYVPGTNGLRFGPQGGLRTNLEGLMAFGEMIVNYGMHNDTAFLDSSTVALMLAPQWSYNGSNGDNYFGLFNSWGLGIHRSLGLTGNGNGDAVIPGEVLYGHTGEAYGLVSDLFVHPESKLVIAFVSTGYLSGGNYTLGSQTTFYQVEEDVFGVFESNYWNNCEQVLNVASLPYGDRGLCQGLSFDGLQRKFRLPEGPNTGLAEVYSLHGRQVWKGRLSELSQAYFGSSGVYLVRWENGDLAGHPCVKKFILH